MTGDVTLGAMRRFKKATFQSIAIVSNGLANAANPVPMFYNSNQDNLTAKAGGGQSGATLLNTMYNRVTTVASAADSTILPASVSGMEISVTNAAATNSMNVFPATGEMINALSANTAFAVAAGKTCTFFCATAGQWHALLSA